MQTSSNLAAHSVELLLPLLRKAHAEVYPCVLLDSVQLRGAAAGTQHDLCAGRGAQDTFQCAVPCLRRVCPMSAYISCGGAGIANCTKVRH